MIESSCGRQFKDKHLKKFMTIVPELYLHKWETRKGKLELFLEIPANIKHILKEQMDD